MTRYQTALLMAVADVLLRNRRADSNEAKALADAKLNVEFELAALGVYLPSKP